jgi:hypothetical protein
MKGDRALIERLGFCTAASKGQGWLLGMLIILQILKDKGCRALLRAQGLSLRAQGPPSPGMLKWIRAHTTLKAKLT